VTGPTLLDSLHAAPEPKRDRWGRPLIPHPQTGREMAFTRVTTFAKSISDTFALTKWELRMALKGLTLRPDLFSLVSVTPTTDKKTLDQVAVDAKEAAGSSVAARQGTAKHTITERVDRGEDVVVPPEFAADISAYSRALAAGKLAVDPNWIEGLVVIPEFNLAGSFDRLLRPLWRPTGHLVGDLKSGRDVISFGMLEISVQLACYAHGAALWDTRTQTYRPLPPIDQDVAVVMHMPVGSGTCDLYAVDIKAGWEAAQLCADVRRWRTRKNLAMPWADWRAGDEESVIAEIRAAESVTELELIWQRAVSRGAWTGEHTSAAKARKYDLSHTN